MNAQNTKNNSLKYLFLGALTVFLCMAVLGVAAWTAINHPAFASILPKAQPPAPIVENNWAQVKIVKPLPNPANGGVISQPNVGQSFALDATPEPGTSPSPTDEPTDIPRPPESMFLRPLGKSPCMPVAAMVLVGSM